MSQSDLPLADLKVLDLMWVMAGPAATRVLADYGATVVRVESGHRVETARTLQPFWHGQPGPEASGLFWNMNAGKLGMTLNAEQPATRDVILDLVRWADVVVESFSPKAMKAWGLDYESLRQVKPDIIMLSSCLMGQTGPLAMFAGFGNLAAAIAGFFNVTGWPDRSPAGPFGAYTDYVSPRFTVAAILAAVDHHRRTGQGQYIDQSQAEAALHFLSPALLDYTVNDHVMTGQGNRDPHMAPHGVYPAQPEPSTLAHRAMEPGSDAVWAMACTVSGRPELVGDARYNTPDKRRERNDEIAAMMPSWTVDRWVAIACRDDDDWRRLADAMEQPRLADDPRFATLADRQAHEDELDAIIGAWTCDQPASDVEQRLQAAGVPAHNVQNSRQAWEDPQLAHRQHFATVPHAEFGDTIIEGTRFHLSLTPARIERGAPTLGEHTFEVLERILGYDADRIAELAAQEVLE
jgi:benzylsuccinate CoA-transferase BbsF subunit